MARVSTQTSPKTVTTVRVVAPLDLKHDSTCVFPSFIHSTGHYTIVTYNRDTVCMYIAFVHSPKQTKGIQDIVSYTAKASDTKV